jgi:YggT family protein
MQAAVNLGCESHPALVRKTPASTDIVILRELVRRRNLRKQLALRPISRMPIDGRKLSTCVVACGLIALRDQEFASWFMRLFFQIFDVAIETYIWVVFAFAVWSWLTGLNAISASHESVQIIGKFLRKATDPALNPIRYFIPVLNGVDASPVFSIMILMTAQYLILLYILPTYF